MSNERISADQLPDIPETQIIEPIVQCGVLYLGTVPPTPGHRGLDSLQEPFSHRYPVDGTNTVQGIDSVLSIYDNGIQLTFVRQPHVVIFFPISSLIYCASLRFSAVENDQTSSIDWRFITLDPTIPNQSKHPPLFCAVVQRTQILPGDECHCFITKSDDAALALVRTISEAYAALTLNYKFLKSPIFYQLDRYGRKISETTGVIYLSPAVDNENLPNQNTEQQNCQISHDRNYLLDSSLNGFFYRTDASIVEQWQLWDNEDDLIGSRPHPPASPFGLHHGLYHDDLTQEVGHYLRRMDDEESVTSCSCSSSSDSSSEYEHYRHRKHRPRNNVDQFNEPFSQLQPSSFEPLPPPPPLPAPTPSIHTNIDSQQSQLAPIVIEKVVPNPMISMPQQQPIYHLEQPQQKQPIYHLEQPQPQPTYFFEQPQQQPQPQRSYNNSLSKEETSSNYSFPGNTYHVNERGEKFTKEGNRILFMDVIQLKTKNNKIEPSKPYVTDTIRPRLHRKRSKHIPIIDLQSIENIVDEKKSSRRRTSVRKNEKQTNDDYLTTSNMLEIIDGYFEDYQGKKTKLNGHDAKEMLHHFKSSKIKETNQRRISHSIDEDHQKRIHSKLTAGPSLNYVERPPIKSPISQHSATIESQQLISTGLNHEEVDEYVSNIYGTSLKPLQSINSSSSSTIQKEVQQPTTTTTNVAVTNQDYISPFRYMQSSINPLLLREYRNAYGGV